MRKRVCVRGISLLLAFVFIFACVSCTRTNGEDGTPTEREQMLTVDTVDVVYSEEFKRQAADKAADVLARLIRSETGIAVSDGQRESFSDMMLEGYIPMLQDERVRPEELDGILLLADTLCSELEAINDSSDGSRMRRRMTFFCVFYRDTVALIGTQRAGRVAYDGLCYYLEGKIEYYEARYEQYGYKWYHSSAQELRKRLNALEKDVDKDTFASAMTVPTFASSVGTGMFLTVDGAVDSMLYDGDIKAILKRQSEYFLSLNITEYQWYVIGNALSALGGESSDTLLGTLLAVLWDEGVTAQSARCMPQLLEFYAAFARELEVEQLAVLRGEPSEEQRIRTVCCVLTKCTDELNALFKAFESYCATETEAEYEAVRSAEMLEELEAFSCEYSPIDSQALLEVIESCANGAAGGEDVRRGIIRYIGATAPYLAFSIYAEETIGK